MPTDSFEWPYVLNLGNTMLGVPMLAMPYCIEQCGCVLGVLLILIAGYLSVESSIYLLRVALVTSTNSYEITAENIYGKFGKSVIATCIIAFIFGIAVASFIIIGDIIPTILKTNFPSFQEGVLFREKVLTFVAIFIILPLCLIKDTSRLVHFSVFSLITYFMFISYLFAEAFYFGPSNIFHPSLKLFDLKGVLVSMPIILTGFSCQSQMLVYLESIPEALRGVYVVKPLLIRAMLLVCVIYSSIGIFGYFTFLRGTIGTDIFRNLSTSFLHQLLRFAFCISVIISYPMVILPIRPCIYSIIFSKEQQTEDVDTQKYYFPIVTIVIIFGSLIFAMLVPNVGVILNVTGGYAGAILSFIAPALMFIKQATKDDFLKGAKIVLIMGIVFLLSSPAIMLIENLKYNSTSLFAQEEIILPQQEEGMPEDVVSEIVIDGIVVEGNVKRDFNESENAIIADGREILQYGGVNDTLENEEISVVKEFLISNVKNKTEMRLEENQVPQEIDKENEFELLV